MKLNEADYKLLEKLYKMETKPLHDMLYNLLRSKYGKKNMYQKVDKYIIAKGSNIGLIAHLDVKGKEPAKNVVYNKEYFTAIDSVLGGDDRTGVFIIIKILELGFKPTIVFTHDEEIGCLGAKALAEDYSSLGVNYLVQLDRKGDGVVFYQNDNKEFIDYILSFRDKKEIGSCSDISHICPSCNVSGCNLGVGYHNEHTSSEYQSIAELEEAISVVTKLLQDEDNSKYWEYVEKKYDYSKYYGYYNNDWDESDYGNYDSTNYSNKEKNNCKASRILYLGKLMTLEEYYKALGDLY